MGDVKVIINEKVASPYLIGLRNPYLILPVMEYGSEQLYYIISHELMHIKSKDIVWKFLIDLLCTAFWWNPIFLHLKKELFHLIEIRNDKRIAAELSEEGKISYMDCLYNTALQLSGKDILFGVAFSKSDVKELKQRIQLLASDRKVCRWQQIVFSICAGVTVLATTMIIFEPYSDDAEEGITADADNTFLLQNGDQYDVYFGGRYVYTTDDIRGYEDVKIYNNLEELEKND